MTPTTKQREQMRLDCEAAIELFKHTDPKKWAERYVNVLMWFWKEYCLGLIFSTSHGTDFFHNVIRCLDGETWQPQNDGEYERNFREFIRIYKQV